MERPQNVGPVRPGFGAHLDYATYKLSQLGKVASLCMSVSSFLGLRGGKGSAGDKNS